LTSSTCFERRVFIIRKTISTYKTALTNGVPDDEHMMFEICRRHQGFN